MAYRKVTSKQNIPLKGVTAERLRKQYKSKEVEDLSGVFV